MRWAQQLALLFHTVPSSLPGTVLDPGWWWGTLASLPVAFKGLECGIFQPLLEADLNVSLALKAVPVLPTALWVVIPSLLSGGICAAKETQSKSLASSSLA